MDSSGTQLEDSWRINNTVSASDVTFTQAPGSGGNTTDNVYDGVIEDGVGGASGSNEGNLTNGVPTYTAQADVNWSQSESAIVDKAIPADGVAAGGEVNYVGNLISYADVYYAVDANGNLTGYFYDFPDDQTELNSTSADNLPNFSTNTSLTSAPTVGTTTGGGGGTWYQVLSFGESLGDVWYRGEGSGIQGNAFLASDTIWAQELNARTGNNGYTGGFVSDRTFTYIEDAPSLCFAAGTLITTPQGERAVETLEIGDLVTTADGQSVPVKWIGRQTRRKFLCDPDQVAPVRITAGALGGGVPHTDLLLTSCHAVILHGLAITAGALVNGTTIIREPAAALPDIITYWHVETEGHRVILANGAPAETYLDYENRRVFDNYDEYVALYGEQPGIEEMNLLRITSARLVPAAIRRQLASLVPA